MATHAVVMMATMTSSVKRAAATGGILLSTIALACGGGGGGDDGGRVSSAQKTVPDRPVRLDPRSTVALVGDTRITREAYDHWYAIARASLSDQPASYVRDNALGFLIRLTWLREEARALGVTITPAQLDAEYDKARRRQFPKPGQYRAFLRKGPLTAGDARAQVESDVLSARLKQRATRGVTGEPARQQASTRYGDALRKRWRSRTTCAPGFSSAPECAPR